LTATPGELLFPKTDGSMRTEEDQLGDRLRRALGRAGIVTGYLHSCRRCKAAGKPYEQRYDDCERRHCPQCQMLLWAKALPRPFRLHDTRHTTATLLLAAGVDLYAVARILRHTDPKVTFETYAHLVPGYLHEQIDRLQLGSFAVQVLPSAQIASGATKVAAKNEPDSEGVVWRAWQESNLRPSASETDALSI
jgi:integrase